MEVLIVEGVAAPMGLYPPALLQGAELLDMVAGGMSDNDCGGEVAVRRNQDKTRKKN